MSKVRDTCATCKHWQSQTSESKTCAGLCLERGKNRESRIMYDGVATYSDYSCPKWEGQSTT